MYLLGKRVENIEPEDIQRLLTSNIQESRSLDYKKEINLQKDSEKKEFLYDLTAMYNTEGGCIVYGIEEGKDERNQNTGIPSKISGITIENSDKLIQLMEDLVKTGCEPSITNLSTKTLTVNEKLVLIIGIPKGLSLPSMVTLGGSNKFYKRRNSGKYAVDVYELNQMFMQNQVIRERAKQYVDTRINMLRNLEVFPNLQIKSTFLIHLIPYSFQDEKSLDFSSLSRHAFSMQPLHTDGWDRMFTYDGYCSYAQTSDRSRISSYDLLMRNGVYEIFTSELFNTRQSNQGGLVTSVFYNDIIPISIQKIKEAIEIWDSFEIDPPFLITFSFYGIRGARIDYGRRHSDPFTKETIQLPPVLCTSFDTDLGALLKPTFDIFWQSVGIQNSPSVNP